MPVWNGTTQGDALGVIVEPSTNAVGARFDFLGRRRLSTTAAPTVAVGAGAGSGASATIAGTDETGTVSITAGTSEAAGILATVTFAKAYTTTPVVQAIVSGDIHSAAAGLYATVSTTALVISATSAITGNTKISYSVVGGA